MQLMMLMEIIFDADGLNHSFKNVVKFAEYFLQHLLKPM